MAFLSLSNTKNKQTNQKSHLKSYVRKQNKKNHFPDLNILVSVSGRSSCRRRTSRVWTLVGVRVTSLRLRDPLLHLTTGIRLAFGALAAAAVRDTAGEEPDHPLVPGVGADVVSGRLRLLGLLVGVGDALLVLVHGWKRFKLDEKKTLVLSLILINLNPWGLVNNWILFPEFESWELNSFLGTKRIQIEIKTFQNFFFLNPFRVKQLNFATFLQIVTVSEMNLCKLDKYKENYSINILSKSNRYIKSM